MKKLLYSIMAMAMIASAPLFLASCSSDDDGTDEPQTEAKLDTPKYAAQAKKVTNLAENSLGWSEIEFTESGIVIIKQVATRASNEKVITGTYIIASNGSYTISIPTFNGEVKVGNDGTITIGEETIKGTTVSADNSTVTEQLSRTWLVNRYAKIDGIRVDLQNRKEFDKTGYPTEFTITKSGTFMVSFSGGTSEAGTWVWNKQGESINIANIASYMFNNFIINYSSTITVRFTIDGTEYEGYLTEKK